MTATMARRDISRRFDNDDELATVRKEVLFRPDEWAELNERLPPGARPGTYLRDVALLAARGQLTDPAMVGTDIYIAPLLTTAPCGDFAEALRDSRRITFSRDLMRILEMQDGDVVVRTVGASMEAAGIPDGAYVVMRPVSPINEPAKGEIALVQIITDDDQYQGTIKRFTPATATTPPELRNGAGELVELPANVRTVQAVAVARGLITRI